MKSNYGKCVENIQELTSFHTVEKCHTVVLFMDMHGNASET